jgi:propanediol dehydratase large subunit
MDGPWAGTIYLGEGVTWDDVLLQVEALVGDGKVDADVIDKLKQLQREFEKDGGLRHLAGGEDVSDYVKTRDRQEQKHGN